MYLYCRKTISSNFEGLSGDSFLLERSSAKILYVLQEVIDKMLEEKEVKSNNHNSIIQPKQ